MLSHKILFLFRENSRQQVPCCWESSRQQNFMSEHFIGNNIGQMATNGYGYSRDSDPGRISAFLQWAQKQFLLFLIVLECYFQPFNLSSNQLKVILNSKLRLKMTDPVVKIQEQGLKVGRRPRRSRTSHTYHVWDVLLSLCKTRRQTEFRITVNSITCSQAFSILSNYPRYSWNEC